jgi:hypothetical protein
MSRPNQAGRTSTKGTALPLSFSQQNMEAGRENRAWIPWQSKTTQHKPQKHKDDKGKGKGRGKQ